MLRETLIRTAGTRAAPLKSWGCRGSGCATSWIATAWTSAAEPWNPVAIGARGNGHGQRLAWVYTCRGQNPGMLTDSCVLVGAFSQAPVPPTGSAIRCQLPAAPAAFRVRSS